MKMSPILTARPAVTQAETSKGSTPEQKCWRNVQEEELRGGRCCRKRLDRESAGSQNLVDVNHVLQENTSSVSMAKCLRTLEQALGHVENRALRSVSYRLIIKR